MILIRRVSPVEYNSLIIEGETVNDRGHGCGSRGVSFVEIMFTMLVLSLIVFAMGSMGTQMSRSNRAYQEKTVSGDLSQQIFTRLNNLPYPYVFDFNSSAINYGLTGSFGPTGSQSGTLPYISVLDEIRDLLKRYGYDGFKVTVKHMVPELSVSGQGQMREFLDADNNGVDDLDPGLLKQDLNGDGDFNDFNDGVTEMPNTHLKEVTVDIYQGSRIVRHDSQLISWEKLTGVKSKASGATIPLDIQSPMKNTILYANTQAAQANALNLALAIKTYPADVQPIRADSAYPLLFSLVTYPSVNLAWKLGSVNGAGLESAVSNSDGSLTNAPLPLATAQLQEGANRIYVKGTAGNDYTEWKYLDTILDVQAPTITNETPVAVPLNTRQPFAGAVLQDPACGNCASSGINHNVTSLCTTDSAGNNKHLETSVTRAVNGMEYEFWVGSDGLPPVLANGTPYYLYLEGGDNAKYKVNKAWSFTTCAAAVQANDTTAPGVSNWRLDGAIPAGTPETANSLVKVSCELRDPESGIDLKSIKAYIDGASVMDYTASITNFAARIEPTFTSGVQDGVNVTFSPSGSLSPGSHQAKIRSLNWNGIENQITWGFNVIAP